MKEMHLMPEAVVETEESNRPALDVGLIDAAMLEPARPFTMPSSRKRGGDAGGLLVGVLLSIVLMSGGLLAWSALLSRNDAAASVPEEQVGDERSGAVAGKQGQQEGGTQYQCATSADALS